ncbi:MAG: HAD-IA family hydrolase [Oscillospiraceae bacterium]|jgi:putative hydrolase of the HAD superfamily|nr:HAD-IA family hydrolase [Oscillospiraceae bacterium]
MITTVLLDYGNVLAHPTSGSWFQTPKTRGILGEELFLALEADPVKKELAFQTAYQFLNQNHLLHTLEEEIAQFSEFFRIFLHAFGFACDDALCGRLGRDLVLNPNKVRFYDDVPYGLLRLKTKYRISLLSDTWPSLRDTLDEKGISGCFDHMVLSCEHNETKQGVRLFEIALAKMGAPAGEIAFVDDSPANLANAEHCGMTPVLMNRGERHVAAPYPTVHNLDDVLTLVQRMNQT